MAALTEAALQQFVDGIGGIHLRVITNEASSGKWHWKVSAAFTLKGTPLLAAQFFKQTPSAIYIVSVIYPTGAEFEEGWAVLDSFSAVR